MPAGDSDTGCEVCGKELLLYKCKYCGRTFCAAHKAPEKHDCHGLGEYRRQAELGIAARPGVSAVEDPEHIPEERPAARVESRRGGFPVKLVAVLAVVIAAILILLLAVGYVVFNTPYDSFSIPVKNATGATVLLVDYKNATDPTYDSLMSFLKADKTIKNQYVYPGFTCADFARELHDHAEASGIRCGFVAIEFDDEAVNYSIYDNGNGKFSPPSRSGDIGHAVDVFNTVDRGLVYIDASSQSDFSDSAPQEVRIAYIAEGKELNGIDLGWATNTSYGFYESYKKVHLELISDQRAYYQDRAKLEAEIKASDGVVTDAMLEENIALNARAIDLNLRESRIGPFYYPQGIVKKVDIYW